MLNLGLNVIEVEGKATPSIQAAPTSVAGVIIGAQRGVPGKVVRVSNWSQFVHRFGSYTKDYYGAYAMRGFFDNGGAVAYVSRVVNEGIGTPTPANLELEVANSPLAIDNDSKLAFVVTRDDVPETYMAEFRHRPAVFKTTPPADTFDLDPGNEMKVAIDEVEQVYTFTSDDFEDGLDGISPDAFSDVVNQKFTGIKAWAEGNEITVQTDRGDNVTSTVEIIDANFSFTKEADSDPPGNVAYLSAVTLNELKTAIENVLTVDVANVEKEVDGIKVTLDANLAGSHNQLTIDESHADSIHDKFTITEEPGKDVNTTNAASVAFRQIDLPPNSSITVEAGYCGEQDPGDWGKKVSVKLSQNPDNQDDENYIDLSVLYNGQEVENHVRLSLESADSRFIADIINDGTIGSHYIRITEVNGTGFEGDVRPVSLDAGNDGEIPSPDQYKAQIDKYDSVAIQLFCCPETSDPAFVFAAMEHCEIEEDRMFVGHAPYESSASPDDIKDDYSRRFHATKRYAALYFPWIQVANPVGTRKWIPPTGHILGVYARTERERGIWKAPAGNAAIVRGALDVQHHLTNTDHTTLVKQARVNAVRYLAGQGIVIDSSRTLSQSTLWLYVNVRLLFNFVKSSLLDGLHWVVQEPNNEELRQKVKYNSVVPFLMGLWRRGAFGPGSPEEVFTVIADDSNNSSDDIEQGIFNLEVYFYPSRPAETIVIRVGQQEGGGSASES